MKKYLDKAKELVAQMTLEEKAGLCSGSDFWNTKGVERLGLPRVMVTDGPHGLRKQAGEADHLGLNQSVKATCFPTAATTACSFDPDLLREMGEALGEECLQENVAVLLGPGANIKRSPLCGRNFEYFSEDPYLTGEMAVALIQGIQSKGVGTSLKHYAANNQETRRMVIDEAIDERALHEIYLTGFKAAVQKAEPWTLMCCYNQVNGEFGSQNRYLLTDILRDEWGFDGLVMTDWGAIVDRVKGLEAGLDLEMPFAGPANDEAIAAAVRDGSLDMEVLDTAAIRVTCMALAAQDAVKSGYDADAHHKLAHRVAAESSVLLKNEGALLPLAKHGKYAVVGAFAETPRYQGAGSSRINPVRLDNLVDVLSQRSIQYSYSKGYSLLDDEADETLLAEAEEAVKGADAAIVCIGLPDAYESEGFDRDHMRLPQSHIALLERVAATNPNTVVLLYCGSPVEMPWIGSAKAALMLYLCGEAGAGAVADLLFGDAVPCGKLAESFPHKLEDNPSYKNFPGGGKSVHYRESIYVGYRYYDKANKDVLFPFGFGLSYTTFDYSELTLEKLNENVIANVIIKNTGAVAGAEIVQFYVSQKNPSVFKPVRELGGFAKVRLQPGESKKVSVTLLPRAFSFYDIESKQFTVETGEYVVSAAASSRDIRCEAEISLTGGEPKSAPQPHAYTKLEDGLLDISANDFETLYGKPLPSLDRQSEERFTMNSTLGDVSNTRAGKALMEQMKQGMGSILGEGGDESMARMMQRMMDEMPLRSLSMFTGGSVDAKQIQQYVDDMNAESD